MEEITLLRQEKGDGKRHNEHSIDFLNKKTFALSFEDWLLSDNHKLFAAMTTLEKKSNFNDESLQ